MTENDKNVDKYTLQKREYFICPVCKSNFTTEDEATRCKYRHFNNNYHVEYKNFTDSNKFPEYIVLRDIKTGEIEIYMSNKSFKEKLLDFKHFNI